MSDCLFCKSINTVDFCTRSNDHGKFCVKLCSECCSAFVWPRPEKNVISAYYASKFYQNLSYEEALISDSKYYPNSDHDAKKILSKCKQLAYGNTFLDIGAGFGTFSKSAIQTGFDVVACEPNPNACKVFRKINGFAPHPTIFDSNFAFKHKAKFDVILLSQVLEHMQDLDATIRNIDLCLKCGGIVAIAVPHFGSALSKLQGKNDMFISPPEHLNYFSKKGLVSLFEANGYKLVYIDTVTKVPRTRIEKIVGIPILAQCAWIFLYALLKSFELIQMGMVLNVFFRKDYKRVI